MNKLLWAAFLLSLTITLATLPLIPAFNEWRRKSDALPLRVVRDQDNNIRHFAQRFLSWLERQGLIDRLHEATPDHHPSLGQLQGGERFAFCLARGLAPEPAEFLNHVVLSRDILDVPAKIVCGKEIYGADHVFVGAGTIVRALYGRKDIRFAREVTLLRWSHAQGTFRTAENVQLLGRVSAEREIRIGPGSRFIRLSAPRIVLGVASRLVEESSSEDRFPWQPHGGEIQPGRTVHWGDLEIAPLQSFHGNLVVYGELHLGDHVMIDGSIKAHGGIRLGNQVKICGALISNKFIDIGPGNWIHGPVVAEGLLSVGPGTIFGLPAEETSVVAPEMRFANGCEIYGSLWARTSGEVL